MTSHGITPAKDSDISQEEAEWFLTLLDCDCEKFTFQTFADKKTARNQNLTRILHGSLEQHFAMLKELNSQGAGVFVTVNKTDLKGRTKENIVAIRAIFVDLDGADLGPVVSCKLEPHVVTQSSHGKYHAYWFVKDCPMEKFSSLQHAVAERFGGDRAVKDLPRVMRLPGFLHQKGQAYKVHIIQEEATQAYTYEQLILEFPIATKDVNKESNAVVFEGKRNSFLTSQAGKLRNQGFEFSTILAALTEENNVKCNPPLEVIEVKSIAESVSRYSSGSANDRFLWDEAVPLSDTTPPVPVFSLDLLPNTLHPWISDIVERMQCSLDYLAVGCLVGLAASVGNKISICPKQHDDWTVFPNLYGGIIGRPSQMKTPALEEVMRPLKIMEHRFIQVFQSELEEHEQRERIQRVIEKEVDKKIKEAHKNGQDPKEVLNQFTTQLEPRRRRLLVTDATMEALTVILTANPNGVLVYRDELMGFLASLEKEGREDYRAFYLEGWSGNGSYSSDRISRKNTTVPKVCLSILGGIQPGKLEPYIRAAIKGGQGDDGLLQRFQVLVWPDHSHRWKNIDREPDENAKQKAYEVFEQLVELPEEGVPRRFSIDAQEVFNQWRHELENRIRGGELHPSLEAHLTKYRSLLPSITLLLDLAEGRRGPVSKENTEKAVKWCEYLEGHANRVYSLVVDETISAAKSIAKFLQLGKLNSGFKARDIYRLGRQGLTERSVVVDALKMLEDDGWIRSIEIRKGGRPSRQYFINPKIFKL